MTHICHDCGAQCVSYTYDGHTLRCLPCADKRKPVDTTPAAPDFEVDGGWLDYAQMRSNADDKRR